MSQAVWGVDVGEAKIAVAMLDPDGAKSRVLELDEKRDPRRFALLLQHARTFLLECTARSSPLAVFVELPTGRFPNPWLTGSWAITCAAVTALDSVYPHSVPLFTIGVTEWKKLTVGKGNAKKVDVEQWVRAQGFAGATGDECDAYAIARAGRTMLDRSERWATAS